MEIFDRQDESKTLLRRLQARASTLVHGPAGVGKTALMCALRTPADPWLYSADSKTIYGVFHNLAADLLERGAERIRRACGKEGEAALRGKSALNVKGIVIDALREGAYVVVLDHIHRPSAAFAAAIRDVLGWAATPVVTIARSPHMEDTGCLHALYPYTAEKLAIRNFDALTALAFARSIAERERIEAANAEELLQRVARHSDGNPGAIRAMLRMARDAKYRSRGHVKITPLYLDYRMNGAAQRSTERERP